MITEGKTNREVMIRTINTTRRRNVFVTRRAIFFNSHLQLNVIVRSYTGANVTEYVFQFINDVFASHNAEYRDQRITNDVEEFRKTKMITHCLDMMKKNHESLLAITQ